MTAYLNRRDLADALVSAVQQLRQTQARSGESAHSVRSAPLSTRQWRVVDRISEIDLEGLVAAFTAGTPKRKLAERYGISESSVKRLLRQRGASKRSSELSRLVAVLPQRRRLWLRTGSEADLVVVTATGWMKT